MEIGMAARARAEKYVQFGTLDPGNDWRLAYIWATREEKEKVLGKYFGNSSTPIETPRVVGR
jgi:hypothetical protein